MPSQLNENNDLISVIIPVYNTEPYLRRSLDSVLNQTYKNLEIVIIDDGSTDGSSRICDEYKDMDSRIVAIHKKNGGLAAARNDGLEIISGDWVAFLDSDDWIEPEMYSTLLKVAKKYNADISSCLTRYCKDDLIPDAINDNRVLKLRGTDIVKGLFDGKVRFEVWDKLWKRSLIGDTRFKAGQVSEEVYFDRILFLKANILCRINRTMHNYLISRPGNTLSSFRKNRICVFDEIDKLSIHLEEIGAIDIAAMARCWDLDFALSMYIQAKETKQDASILKEIKEAFMRDYKACKNKCCGREWKKRMMAELFQINSNLCYHYVVWKRNNKKRLGL